MSNILYHENYCSFPLVMLPCHYIVDIPAPIATEPPILTGFLEYLHQLSATHFLRTYLLFSRFHVGERMVCLFLEIVTATRGQRR